MQNEPTSLHSFQYADTPAQPQAPQQNTVQYPSEPTSTFSPAVKYFLPLCLAVIVAGSLTGLGLQKLRAQGSSTTFQGQEVQKVAKDASSIQNGQVFGSANEAQFKDSAEGFLVAGGIDGEGSHHLQRAGGVSQTVYLTSSVTDMSKFEGMDVKVWGETFKGQKAGWLMDVGRVQVQNTKGTAPTEE